MAMNHEISAGREKMRPATIIYDAAGVALMIIRRVY
jgi:hypothetical protein